MPGPGVSIRLETAGSASSSATRQVLVEAAIETLRSEGFAGLGARTLARWAGRNQALVLYHFGSVASPLPAALDSVSTTRLDRYGTAVQYVCSQTELVEVAAEIFREDLEAGHVTVLVEMIAGAASTPGLGVEVAARIAAWNDFALRTIYPVPGSALGPLVSSTDVAHGAVALYPVLELLSHLDGDRAQALNLFGHVERVASLAEVFVIGGPSGEMVTPPVQAP